MLRSVMSRLLLALVLTGAAGGCDTNPVPDRARYQGVLLNTEGVAQFDVEVSYDRPAVGQTTSGTYTLRGGLEGRLDGELRASASQDGGVSLSLLVPASDSGKELVGTPAGDRFDGEWFELTIAGPVRAGTFRLEAF